MEKLCYSLAANRLPHVIDMFGAGEFTMAVDLDWFYPTHQAGVGNRRSGDYRAIHHKLIVRFALTRHLFLLWGAGFMAIAMSREIHFSGSDEILLIGWPMLLGIALWRYDVFKTYLENPVLINFLAGGFLFYILSQTIDQRWWKGLPGEGVVHVPLEELTEILGHCTVGFVLLFSRQVQSPRWPPEGRIIKR